MPRYLFTYPKDDNDFRPNQRTGKMHKIVKKRKQTKIYNRNGWDEDENRKYREFLEANSQLLMNREQRRQKKVFLRLSQHVQTRDANQCRSHHQKMMQKYKTIQKILQFLRFLEDKQDCRQKDNSTCQIAYQMSTYFQEKQIQQIDKVFELNQQHNSFNQIFEQNPVENYFNFLQDDVWLN